MISRKLAADLALVCAIFLATAGIVEAQKIYHGYIDPSFIDVQLRGQTLQRRISDGLESGGLTKLEADSLTNQLQSIENTTVQGNGRLNARLHSQLDKMSSQVDLTMRNRNTATSSIAEIVAKKASIRHQLSTASPINAARIERKLGRISAYENYLLMNHGGLTYWQRKKINADLDLLTSQLSAWRSKVSFASN